MPHTTHLQPSYYYAPPPTHVMPFQPSPMLIHMHDARSAHQPTMFGSPSDTHSHVMSCAEPSPSPPTSRAGRSNSSPKQPPATTEPLSDQQGEPTEEGSEDTATTESVSTLGPIPSWSCVDLFLLQYAWALFGRPVHATLKMFSCTPCF